MKEEFMNYIKSLEIQSAKSDLYKDRIESLKAEITPQLQQIEACIIKINNLFDTKTVDKNIGSSVKITKGMLRVADKIYDDMQTIDDMKLGQKEIAKYLESENVSSCSAYIVGVRFLLRKKSGIQESVDNKHYKFLFYSKAMAGKKDFTFEKTVFMG
jgi:hypothetical protein